MLRSQVGVSEPSRFGELQFIPLGQRPSAFLLGDDSHNSCVIRLALTRPTYNTPAKSFLTSPDPIENDACGPATWDLVPSRDHGDRRYPF